MVHLTTVVGTRAELLPRLFAHYRQMGIDSLLVGVHLEHPESPFLAEVTLACRAYGATIAAVYVGPWFQRVNPFLYRQIRRRYVDDWHVLADGDEFQVYPTLVPSFLEALDREGYDYVEGCVLDRIARDGSFPAFAQDESLCTRYPLAGILTQVILRGNILKIAATKGFVEIGAGQHAAFSGRGCPRKHAFIPIHHFKWFSGVTDRLRERIAFYQSVRDTLWIESARFLNYLEAHDGRIDVSDDRLWLASCDGYCYSRWDDVRALVCARAIELGLRSSEESGT